MAPGKFYDSLSTTRASSAQPTTDKREKTEIERHRGKSTEVIRRFSDKDCEAQVH